MSIQVECEQCGAKRKVNERLAGRTIRCPGCEQALTIPPPTPVAEAVEAATAEAVPVQAEAIEVTPVHIPEPVAAGRAASVSRTVAVTNHASAGGGTAVATASPVTAEPQPKMDDDDDEDLVPPRKKREDGELDMTPMVDVTFLLLIFFMVTASFSLQKSIQMPRQSSDLPSMSNVEEETEELDPIELEIDESGAFLVLAPEWERETPGKQNLTTALKEAIGDNRDGMKLDIKVHENAKLQMLVDGMDAGTIAGFTEIQVTEVDGFD